jgi:hypothetical protein
MVEEPRFSVKFRDALLPNKRKSVGVHQCFL